MKRTNRILALLLSLVMIAGLVPLGAIESAATAKTDEVAFFVERPYEGAHPSQPRVGGDFRICTDQNSDGYTNGVRWSKGGEKVLTTNDTFYSGVIYWLEVEVEAANGYVFDSDHYETTLLRTNVQSIAIAPGHTKDTMILSARFTGTEALLDPVPYVDLTVPEPAPGEAPASAATISTGARKCSLLWQKMKDGIWVNLAEDELFEAGVQYRVDAFCVAPTGMEYDYDVSGEDGWESYTKVWVNAAAAQTWAAYTNYMMRTCDLNFIYDFGVCGATVESVEFVAAVPVAGATPAIYITPMDWENYGFDRLWWYKSNSAGTGGREMEENETFEAGSYYFFQALISPKLGGFAVNGGQSAITATINGESARSIYSVSNESPSRKLYIVSPVYQANNVLTTVNFEIETPSAGEHPAFTAIASDGFAVDTSYTGSTGTFHGGIQWMDMTTSKIMAESDGFQTGHKYRAMIVFKTLDGYSVGSTFTATASGARAESKPADMSGGNKTQFQVQFFFNNCPGPQIKTVAVTAPNVKAGGSPRASLSVGNSSYYRVDNTYTDDRFTNGYYWIDATTGGRMDNDFFHFGHAYTLTVRLVPSDPDALTFAVDAAGKSTVKATVNGNAAEVTTWADPDAAHAICVAYTFKSTGSADPLTSFSVYLDAPEIGVAPDFEPRDTSSLVATMTDYNENGFVNGVRWYGDGKSLTRNSAFQPNVQYLVSIRMELRGVKLANDCTVYFNDNVIDSYNVSNNVLSINYQFPMLTKTISQVELHTVLPSIGKTIDFDPDCFTLGAQVDVDYNENGFVNGVQWLDLDRGQGEAVLPGSSFVEGHRYTVTIAVAARIHAEGCYFPDGEMSAKINGLYATVNPNGSEDLTSKRLISYAFDPCDSVIVSSAEVTVASPVEGEQVPFTASTGIGYEVKADYQIGTFTDGVEWYDETAGRSLEPGASFEVGHVYTVSTVLAPQSGYAFELVYDPFVSPHPTSLVAGLVNGELATTSGLRISGSPTFIEVSYTFDPVVSTLPCQHVWGDAGYEWAQDLSTCTGSHTCTLCGAVETETVEITYTPILKQPDEYHGTPGIRGYFAYFTKDGFETQSTTREYYDEPECEHVWGEVNYQWADDNSTCTASRVCTLCQKVDLETTAAQVEIITEATENAPGMKQYTASFADPAFETQVKEAPYEYVAFLWGDANGDGAISNKDIVRLKNYLANYDEITGLSSVELAAGADANGDGAISNKDVVRLKNYLANFDENTGLSSVILGPA